MAASNQDRLHRLGELCARRRVLVVVAWVALVALTGGLMRVIGTDFALSFDLPESEAARGFEILEASFPNSGVSGTIVYKTDAGVSDPAVQAAMTDLFQRTARIDGVLEVVSPYEEFGARQIAAQGESAGKIAYATVNMDPDLTLADFSAIGDEIQAMAPAGVQLELGGQVFGEFEPPNSELLGLAFAIFILIIAFGSVLAMGLPIGTALAGVGVGVALIGLLSNLTSMPDFASTLGSMIGLGVGIDYALFIVTRYRENIERGMETETAIGAAIATAGRAVIFAGITVVISLLGMLLMGVSFISGLGIGGSVTVTVTMLASITLLPALLSFAGHRIFVTRVRGLAAASLIAVALIGAGISIQPLLVGAPLAVVVLVAGLAWAPLKREIPRPAKKPVEQTGWYRWSRTIQRHPAWWTVGGLLVLVVMSIPVFSLRLGFSDDGNAPEDSTTRRAYDLITEGFGPGFNGPLLLVSEVPASPDPASFMAVTAALSEEDGVAFASPPVPNDLSAPTAILWTVVPTTSPQSEATSELMSRLREEVIPRATSGTGLEISVTGSVAANADFSSYLGNRLFLFFGVVLALSFLLLMTVFRSVLVPVKAVIMNLISIGAAYGLIVAVFQWGWGASVIGLGTGAPIEPFIPMMMFAIVFGLSMDYEVFLLSRIKEEYDATGDNDAAVADGLAVTARVITAAAAIMVFVFGSFLLEPDRIIKMFGLGLASAVLLDASIVRLLLVPATMALLGDRNWWLPGWLDRILPKVSVEGSEEPTHAELV